jgi:type IV pilus modification protein PilV
MFNAVISAFDGEGKLMFMKKSTEIPKSVCTQGFSFIEVLIAMAIFAIGILAVGSMQISAINTNAKARNSTTVVTMAKDRAEELIALPYDDADLVGSADPGTLHTPAASADGIDNDEDGQIDEAGEAGQVSISWNVIEDQPLPGTKSIRVTVTRTVRTSQRSSTLDFIKANM